MLSVTGPGRPGSTSAGASRRPSRVLVCPHDRRGPARTGARALPRPVTPAFWRRINPKATSTGGSARRVYSRVCSGRGRPCVAAERREPVQETASEGSLALRLHAAYDFYVRAEQTVDQLLAIKGDTKAETRMLNAPAPYDSFVIIESAIRCHNRRSAPLIPGSR